MNFGKILSLAWNTSKCGGVWQILCYPSLKMRKLCSRVCECDFIGYACNSSYYRLLFIKSDILDYNTII
jgi:hypothetical protein